MYATVTTSERHGVARRLLLVVAVTAASFAALLFGAAEASAATVPYHKYSFSCPRLGYAPDYYWGNYLKALPTRLDSEADVGQSILGSGGQVTTQYIYFRLWAWSYKDARWVKTWWKRVRDGYPIISTPIEAYDSSVGYWMNASLSLGSSDMNIGANEVGLRELTGSGRWYFGVETYWAPASVSSPDPRIYAPAAGGIDTFDAAGTCDFS